MTFMFDTCHPVYCRLHELCKNIDEGTILNTFYTYMELCEVKRLWDVAYHFNEEFNILYLTARKTKTSEADIYITLSVLQDISIEDIEKLQRALLTESVILVFKEGDSTSVYYKVSGSLIKPLSPEESKKAKLKDEKKFDLERDIKRHTSNLFEMAKSLSKNDNDGGENLEENPANEADVPTPDESVKIITEA